MFDLGILPPQKLNKPLTVPFCVITEVELGSWDASEAERDALKSPQRASAVFTD